jgi:methionyl-tRNA synthetase
MLLAAETKKEDGSLVVEVLDAGDAPTGTRVILDGNGDDAAAAPPGEIGVDAFFSVPLAVTDSTVVSDGRSLTLNGKPIRTSLVQNGGVH